MTERSNTARKPSSSSAHSRYRAAVPIERANAQGPAKKFWHTVGAAFFNDNGSVTIDLNSLPLPGPDGRCRIVLFPPGENEGQDRSSPPTGEPRGGDGDLPY